MRRWLPYLSVNRQDVALKLELLPSVNEHNVIRLDVEQEVSDVEAPNYNGLGPATSKRSTKTTVVARDQQTVIIGGLMSDRASETITKVPDSGRHPGHWVLLPQHHQGHEEDQHPDSHHALCDFRFVGSAPGGREEDARRREFIERYSSLQDRVSLDKDMDFRRKRGMLEEINKAVRDMEDEEQSCARYESATRARIRHPLSHLRPSMLP